MTRLKSRFAGAGDLDFNLDVFDGETASADNVVGAANTMPFMSERRLVIVRFADKMNAAALNEIAEYAEDPSPTTVLVLVMTKADKRTRLYKAVDKSGQVSEYAAPKRGEYPGLVVEMFEALGVRVSREAASVLVEAVGTDLARLSSEVDKVAAYVGPENDLGRDEVLDVVSRTAPVRIWALEDTLGARDLEASLRVTRELINQGESVFGLHALAVRYVRSLLAIKALAARGESQAAIASRARVQPWKVGALIRQASAFDEGELRAALAAAARSEAEMKTSPVETGLVFERWIATVCRATP